MSFKLFEYLKKKLKNQVDRHNDDDDTNWNSFD